jgi:hypothetical protein
MPGVITKAVASIEPAAGDEQDDGPGSFHVLLSATTEDRDGDTLAADEWAPMPEHITFDTDHGMSVATTVGSGTPELTERGIEVHGTYSSLPRAQEVRTLVNEGHIRTTSVAFMTTKTKAAGGEQSTRRELLNGAFVAVPSNREALVLSSKALDVAAKEGRRNSEADAGNIQLAHDALVALGASCDPSTRSYTRRLPGRKAIAGSVEALQERVADALRDTYSQGEEYVYTWPRAVIPDDAGGGGTVIFERYAGDDEGCWQQTYTDDGAVVTLTGDAVEVDIQEIVTPDADADREGADEGLTGTGDAASAPVGDSPSADDAERLNVRAQQLASRAARLAFDHLSPATT